MIINEARVLLDELDVTHPLLPVRLVFGIPMDKAHEVQSLMASIKKAGYAANLQSSAYGDIELVVTDGDVGDAGSSQIEAS
jgi:hypothetical protein